MAPELRSAGKQCARLDSAVPCSTGGLPTSGGDCLFWSINGLPYFFQFKD